MKTQIHTSQRQSQQLGLSPQMQQSLKILQMGALELKDVIDSALLENPFLEAEPPSSEPLSCDSADQDNPYLSYWTDHGSRSMDESAFDTNATPTTLKTHLAQQLGIQCENKEQREIGPLIIDAIDENGFLNEDDLPDGTTDHPHYQDTLNLIHAMDPIGVGARSLVEVFSLQLRDQGLLTPDIEKVLSNLTLLTEKGPDALARSCAITLNQLKDYIAILRTLDPKPGLSFSLNDPTQYIIPDLIFRKMNGHWVAEINPQAYPNIKLDRLSYQSVSQSCRSNDDLLYINKQASNASWLIKSLEQRVDTLTRVATAIIERQETFLNRGMNYLAPLKLKEIAVAIEMHESTVSRAVNGKYAATPFGVVELKSFFAGSVSIDQEGLSNKTIQMQIKNLIDMEPKTRPLSDDQIVISLKAVGISVARRTVTKYREALHIPSSYERKKISFALSL
ncbi:MAG: RNA polymerase factor sigma-54 [Candidatus Paracaedibacteraceae bacterium]|nr:RNA polymerase factor sigma-54 [Candidatus Paracaedibacteraceae bacterium]